MTREGVAGGRFRRLVLALSEDGLFSIRTYRNDLDRPRTIAVQFRGQVVEVVLQPGEMRWFD